MKIRFPNPYGYPLPPAGEVVELQAEFEFSDAYADFLKTQNGLLFDHLDAAGDAASAYLHGTPTEPGYPDVRVLFGFRSRDPHYELADRLCSTRNLFHGVFLPIGEGYDGAMYVEVLAGRQRGCIASLDHEMHAGANSLADFCKAMELGDPAAMSTDALADALMDDALGLAWVHADDFASFLGECLHLDSSGCGRVIDAQERG
ncbi:hypothetical protein [Luteimonas sp. e5]